MKKILLVEDDVSLGENLLNYLSKEYDVEWAKTVIHAKQHITANRFDLAILDVGLPDGDGYEIARVLQKKTGCKFIFLTARSDAESRLKGYELGSREYIPKPFYLKELSLRLNHLLLREDVAKDVSLKNCVLQFSDMSVRHSNGKIEYPPVTDMKILKLLIERFPKVVSRDQVIDQIWGVDKTPNFRTIDNVILRLRQMLGDEGEMRIRTVRGVGYQWIQDGKRE